MTCTPFNALACPLDGFPLLESDACWRCEAGHSFDIARQGYIHLLPVQKKRSKNPGDSKDMVAARRRFLASEVYKPVAEAVNRAVWDGLPSVAEVSCLDAGCGEGYYLRKLAGSASEGHSLSVLGVDISKAAIQAAAKRDIRCRWLVASNADLPVLSRSFSRILCLFGFPVYSEFLRVLAPKGRIIQADAGYDHLRELREIIYPELKPAGESRAHTPEGFELLGCQSVRYTMDLSNQDDIADLLAMTPHLYRATPIGRQRAAALEALRVTVDVVIRCYEKR
jgi:23S rRNA (guanine745-N1)-methyltransferase